MGPEVGEELAHATLEAEQNNEAGSRAQRIRVALLKARLGAAADAESRELFILADSLVKRAVWIVGGDGWAYDIGYGGLDHVLASGHHVNILRLDTQSYSHPRRRPAKPTA